MLPKVLCFIVLIQIIVVCRAAEKFTIKNLKTGMVLGDVQGKVKIGQWEEENYQLWTKEPSNKPGYFFIRNVASGKVLTACPMTNVIILTPRSNSEEKKWTFNSLQHTLKASLFPNRPMMFKNSKVIVKPREDCGNCDQWSMQPPAQ